MLPGRPLLTGGRAVTPQQQQAVAAERAVAWFSLYMLGVTKGEPLWSFIALSGEAGMRRLKRSDPAYHSDDSSCSTITIATTAAFDMRAALSGA